MKKRKLNILDLPFISILDRRPKDGQFILLAWDINGYCGFESTYWNNTDTHCQHAVAWVGLSDNHVLTRHAAVILAKRAKFRPTILNWSKHFSTVISGKYVSTDKLKRVAHVEQGSENKANQRAS